jgi:tRNA(fMet)-specific endonuclease VapC
MGIVCLDSSILIDYFRKKDKSETRLFQLAQENYTLAVPTIVEYEFWRGMKDPTDAYWRQFFDDIKVLDFNRACAQEAANIYAYLKSIHQHEHALDILIAATAKVSGYPIATLNSKHFEKIPGISMI